MNKIIATLTIAVSAIGFAGCALRSPSYYKPPVPSAIDVHYQIADYQADKKAYDAAPSKESRDRMVRKLEREIEINYSEYELGFGSTRAGLSTIFDTLESGAGIAGSLIGSEASKEILSVSLLGIQNQHRSIDKNFFANVSAEIIIAAMRGAREAKRLELDKKLALDVASYPFEEAQLDLTQLYYSGTLQSALQALSQASAARANQTDSQKDATLTERLNSPK